MTSPTESERGWMSDPSDSPRPHHRPRATPYSGWAIPIARQNAAVGPIRSSWTWGPGPGIPTRHYLASRRQSPPARFQRLSRSTSPRRTLPASYYYEDLLHEALQSGAAAPFPEAAAFSVVQGAAPPFAVHHLWPSEDCVVSGTQQSMDGVISLSLPEAPPVLGEKESDDDQAQQDDSDDSFLDEPYQAADVVPRLEADHQLYRLKDPLVQRAQNIFTRSQRFPHPGSQQAESCRPLFACPFFSRDPEKYWFCLEDTSTATIVEVKRHLWRHHSQPYYCPVCYDTFPLASERDNHILERTCTKRDDVVHFDGMSPEQRAVISTKEKGESGPRQWGCIWKILFGRPRDKLEPFLPPALSWNVLLVTEFWKARGREITEQFLGDMERIERGMSGEKGRADSGCRDADENAVSGLVNAVLRDLVRLTFWRSGLVRNLGNIMSREGMI